MFKFKRSNEKDFIKAYEKFADAIFRHCYFRVNDRELAKDLLQDTFTKTWDFISRGGEIKNFRPFLYKVANNLVIDYYRSKKTAPLSLDELKEKGVEPRLIYEGKESPELTHLREDLLKIISGLEQSYREVIIMRYIDELSIKEISGALNDSENAIYVRLHRGLKKLKEILKKHEKDF